MAIITTSISIRYNLLLIKFIKFHEFSAALKIKQVCTWSWSFTKLEGRSLNEGVCWVTDMPAAGIMPARAGLLYGEEHEYVGRPV